MTSLDKKSKGGRIMRCLKCKGEIKGITYNTPVYLENAWAIVCEDCLKVLHIFKEKKR